MTSQTQALADLAAQIRADEVCPELAAAANSLVMGEGDSNARVIFIGEAPGRLEDETGRPFVGAAGKILDQLLDSAGVSRSEVYITSIIKYRPPNNRDPSPVEKAAFWPYLERQIEIIDPDYILTLGRHGLSAFLPEAQIRDVHGLVQNVVVAGRERHIIPQYHPAAAIYNRKLRDILTTDMVEAFKIINQ
ncbi:uracil-DNA glycosylase [Candidatus Saccharibacteria bacterium 32-49-12]|nr:MAG: uracil-DNA glycosylase [Candidatus Saccharibacteria bacterium 32-49-12]